ncbi:MAG: hypothetical protein LBV23_00645 [Deltaproteobacteria bacterium]|jgi:hypothetical protein|nr:hypothetical protein [Deltaproteobacteria bacterium]
MFNEFDVIKANKDISNRIKKSCIGIIMLIYNTPYLAYVAEFIDKINDTIDFIAVKPEDISIIYKWIEK